MLDILITDGMESTSLRELKNLNFNIVERHLTKEDLIKEIKDYHILVVRSATKVTREVIDGALETGKLKLIIRAGVGLDNIDVAYAKDQGIIVENTPNGSNTAVAELVIGHILNLARFIHQANISLKKGQWNKKMYQGMEIEGKTLGIVGFGRIGRELAKKARALGMKIKYYDIMYQLVDDGDYEYCDFHELLKTSDFISLHVPYKKGEKAVIGKEEINKMKDGAYLINCARGGVVDEEALLEALNSNKLAGAAIDVFLNEPNPNLDLCKHEKVSVTPHIGASTKEAQEKIGQEVKEIIIDFWKRSRLNDQVKTI